MAFPLASTTVSKHFLTLDMSSSRLCTCHVLPLSTMRRSHRRTGLDVTHALALSETGLPPLPLDACCLPVRLCTLSA